MRADKSKMIKQKLLGIGMLLLCIAIGVFAIRGKTPEDRDITPVLLFLPIGLGLLFSKDCWVY